MPGPSDPTRDPSADAVAGLGDGPFGPLFQTTVRVMTWNLWWRFGPWEARRGPIAATVAEAAPDILALQEVWGHPGGPSFAGLLAEELGYHHVDAWRHDADGVTFGNAILARWPIVDSEWRPLPTGDEPDEWRTVVFAEIDGPRGRLQVFCTHLNWRFDHSHVRQEQVGAIAAFIAERRNRSGLPDERPAFPPVLCGDLNACPDAEEIRMLTGRRRVAVDGLVFHDAWEVAGEGEGCSWSNRNPYARRDLEPDRRIDYVLVGWPKRGGAGQAVACRLGGTEPVGGVVASDHYAVIADLRY